MNARILMTCKSDVANFPSVARFNQSGIGAFFVKDAVRIFLSENFMMLDEVDTIDAEALQRLVELAGRFLL